MKEEIQTRLENALIVFVERASKENAKSEEVEVLADVANVLSRIYKEG